MPAIMEFGRLYSDPLIALHRLKNLGQLLTDADADADADVELCLPGPEGSGHARHPPRMKPTGPGQQIAIDVRTHPLRRPEITRKTREGRG